MKTTKITSALAIALAILVGIAIGAIGEALHAQAKPPVYMIANNEVTNPEGYKNEYLPLAKKSIKDHGGVYVAAGKGFAITGEPPKGRLVILRWESMEQLMAWWNSPDYKAANKIGAKYAKYNLMAVDGVAQK
jgi:uncharacterized protein (DUF1330 family)